MVRALHVVVAAGLVAAGALAGCSGGLVEGQPTPTPTDFGGIVTALGSEGISTANPRSGDAGCTDPNLVPTSISFMASGLGMTTPSLVRVYIFGSDAAYQRLQPAVDACAARWATDPATFELVEATPYVVAGQGPWPPGFKVAVQQALRVASGAATPAPS